MYKNIFYVLPKSNNYFNIYNCNTCLERNNICNRYYVENFQQITLHNFWPNPNENQLKEIFSKILKKSKKTHIKIYSVFGENINLEKNNNILNVQFSGESRFKDPSLFDINLGPFPTKNNTITFLYGFFELLMEKISIHNFTIPRKLTMKKKEFCLFAVSNSNCEIRNNFFLKLKKYKNILSCGSLYKNFTCPSGRGKEYLDNIKKFKFMICFENNTKDYYFTEKCILAYLGGAIPIYWGCPQVTEFLNMNSILYLPPNFTPKEEENLIKRIIEIDNNDNLYKQIYEQTFFKMINNKIPDVFNIDSIINNINKIL
jgi:hypothetical protein